MPLINTAYSSHKRCFICRIYGTRQRLVEIDKDSVIQGYTEHNLYIKHHSRCCARHLDLNGRIRDDEFEGIPRRMMNIDNQTLFLLKSLKIKTTAYKDCKKPIIDQFRNIDNIDENTCMLITGWNKAQFLRFSSYIHSIYETKKRNKYQLIALYRLWLRIKNSQQILATFISNGTQRQISRNLEQIRRAIHKDFTPSFLGASRASRDFFLSQNTLAVKELHQLKEDELAIIADGSYARCEKSSSNEFQYSSWSSQKKASLVKPFFITCASGWIIDCYGPFRANQNDAQIFKCVLESDMNLRSLLEPEKTIIFIDRG